jgi:hypothetical protein
LLAAVFYADVAVEQWYLLVTEDVGGVDPTVHDVDFCEAAD